MAFQVKDLMVTLEPARAACGPATIDTQCPTASAGLEAVSETRRHLALLRHQLGAAMARFN
jgi:hypothetical protein